MSRLIHILTVILLMTAASHAVLGCPSCQEALVSPSGTEASPAADRDPFREARAYHYSVYLMVGMPYALLAGVGFMIWRAVRLRDRMMQQPAAEGGTTCPDPSPDVPS